MEALRTLKTTYLQLTTKQRQAAAVIILEHPAQSLMTYDLAHH